MNQKSVLSISRKIYLDIFIESNKNDTKMKIEMRKNNERENI